MTTCSHVVVFSLLLAACGQAADDLDAHDLGTRDAIVETPSDVPDGPLGRPFPVTSLTACDGSIVDLASPSAAATWLVLTAGNCPSCKDQLPFVADVTALWAPRGVQVIVVLGDDGEGSGRVSPAYCEAFRADFGLPGLVARDDGFASLGGFADSPTPVQIVLDAELTVRAMAAGWDEGFHPGWIEREIGKVLPPP